VFAEHSQGRESPPHYAIAAQAVADELAPERFGVRLERFGVRLVYRY
jgi:hypothetical protein